MASTGATFVSEEPSLWRDYEGRENARDRGVLTRTNRSLRLDLDSAAARGDAGELVYALDVEVQTFILSHWKTSPLTVPPIIFARFSPAPSVW